LAPGRQSRRTVTADAARLTDTAYPADSTDAARLTDTAYPADSTDAARLTNTTYPADSADAARLTDTAYPADSTDAARLTDTAYPADTADTTHATNTARSTAGNRIPIEAVVMVDVDATTAPAAPPAPTAAPKRPHQHSGAEGDRRPRGVAPRRIVDRRIWIDRGTVGERRVIRRHVQNFRIRRLDHHHALVFDYFCFYRLLWGALQGAFILGLHAHALNGAHHIALLGQKGVAQIGGPLDVVPQLLHDIRQSR
jgi:hypothetical protein